MSEKIILSEKPEDNKEAAEWGKTGGTDKKERGNYRKADKKIYPYHLVTQYTDIK